MDWLSGTDTVIDIVDKLGGLLGALVTLVVLLKTIQSMNKQMKQQSLDVDKQIIQQSNDVQAQIFAAHQLAEDNRKEDKKSSFSDNLLDLQELISFYNLSTKDRKVVVQMRKIFNHLLILQHSYTICNIEIFKKFDDETRELETALSDLIELKIKESKIVRSYSSSGSMSVADQQLRDDLIIENAKNKQKECVVLQGKFSKNFHIIFKELLSN